MDLGNEIYRTLKLKYDTISKALKEEQEEIDKTIMAISSLVDMTSEALENSKT